MDVETAVKGVVHGCNHLCIRKEPSKDSDVVGILPKGTKMDCVAENDNWYSIREIEEYGVIGYCMGKYVKVLEENEVDDGRRKQHIR